MVKKTDDTPGSYSTLDPLTFQADHHTDLWIARRVMEWPEITEHDRYVDHKDFGGVIIGNRAEIFRFGTIPDAFHPSSRMEDALEVLRKMREKGWQYILSSSLTSNETVACFTKIVGQQATAETEPLAICRAAGVAVISESA